LWERFGWSEIDTDHISMRKMREIFTALNQQRYSRDAVENLGKPDTERHERILADEQRIRQEKHNEVLRRADEAQRKARETAPKGAPPKGVQPKGPK